MVQWLRRLASIVGGTGLITGQETKIPHETVKKINKRTRNTLQNINSSYL